MIRGGNSYVQLVKEKLETGGSISSFEAFVLWGNTRLSATIYTLRHTYDMPIKMRHKRSISGKQYGEYYLDMPIL